MSKTIGLPVWSGGTLTRTAGAPAVDSSCSISGAFSWYLAAKAFNSACSAAVNGSPVTGAFKERRLRQSRLRKDYRENVDTRILVQLQILTSWKTEILALDHLIARDTRFRKRLRSQKRHRLIMDPARAEDVQKTVFVEDKVEPKRLSGRDWHQRRNSRRLSTIDSRRQFQPVARDFSRCGDSTVRIAGWTSGGNGV